MNASFLKHFLTEMFCQVLVGFFFRVVFFFHFINECGFLDVIWLEK